MTARDAAPPAPPQPTGSASRSSRPRRRTRRATGVLLGTAVAGLWLLTATRWLDAAVPQLLPALQALVPLLAVPAAVLLLLTVLARARRSAVAAAALVAVHLALAAPWWLPPAGAPDPGGAPRFTVVAGNVQYGWGDAPALARAALARDADVLVLVEATAATLADLEAAGIDDVMPHRAGAPAPGAAGALVLSRHPLTTRGVPRTPEIRYELPVVTVQAPGGDVLLGGIHPVSPVPPDAVVWHRELTALAAWAATTPADVPLVLAGDFNATADHPVYRRFRAAGVTDVRRALRTGRPRTWPDGLGRIPLLFDLDHVLARGLVPVDAGTLHVAGTDHVAVWATLARPGGG